MEGFPQKNCTHHPGVTPPAVDEPPRNLAGGLDNQQAAETLEQLEDGARVAQHIIPCAQRDRLHKALLPKEPVLPRLMVRRRNMRESPRHPSRAPRVDREAAQRPDQQRRDNEPLRQADKAGKEPSYPRLLGCQELADAVEKVEEEEGERVGQAGIATPYVEGDGY